MEVSDQTTARLRKIGEIKLEERSMSDLLEARPNTTINLKNLEDRKISEKILERGLRLKKEGRPKRNSLYPWRFMVSGDKTERGITAYQVDIAEHTCSCGWFTNTGSTCKHLVAALLVFMEEQIDSVV